MDRRSSKVMKRINYLITETDAAYHDAAVRLGLSDSAMQILYTMCDYEEGEPCPLQEVCRRTGISKQTINSAIRKLEAEGIVYLESAGAKFKNLRLTEAGKSLTDRTVRKIIQIENSIVGSWPAEDAEKYLELTERFLLSFKEQTKKI